MIRGGPWDGSKLHRRRYCPVKAYAWDFEMAQLQIGSSNWLQTDFKIYDHVSKLRDGSKLEAVKISNRVSVRIVSYLRVSGLKKMSNLGVLTRDRRFWAISRTPAYLGLKVIRPKFFSMVICQIECQIAQKVILDWFSGSCCLLNCLRLHTERTYYILNFY